MLEVDLQVADEAWSALGALETCVVDACAAVAGRANLSGEVSLLLTNDAEMQELNRTWRKKDAPTDVLAFPADPMDAPFLGDIAIGYGVASADAAASQTPLNAHLAHLVIHGVLHLAGHDHMEDTAAEEMMALERAALASLGLPDPYEDRV